MEDLYVLKTNFNKKRLKCSRNDRNTFTLGQLSLCNFAMTAPPEKNLCNFVQTETELHKV